MLNVLIVPDGPESQVQGLLDGNKVDVFENGGSLFHKVKRNHYHVAVLEGALELIPSVKVADPRVMVFFIGDRDDVDEVEIIATGASAVFRTPLDTERFRAELEKIGEFVRVKKETEELERALSERYTFAGIVGRNPRMLEIFDYLRRIAPYFKTVTVLGETGVGKEEIARALHSISPSSRHPFIACNCGALNEHLIESDFFGHKRGAFTGAITDKAGIFEAAGEGTVFLDEIGDLPLSFQPHLLRVLQNGDFRKVGSNAPLKARCRVIAATNRDLGREVREKRFREDLYFRLTPLVVQVPPLKERPDDIALLSRHILARFQRRTGKSIRGIAIPAQKSLMSYDWPGNVRELENVIEHIAILTNEEFIGLEDLPSHIRDNPAKEERKGAEQKMDNADPASTQLDALIRNHIRAVLMQCNGNKSRAARALGISRRTLFRKIEESM
ncbi:MAG: sigma-54-dependent Fis family transcriptional regulator, partial [Deltaproteobacteria bacterium]|nr:sigma-54-dependent Fis family transcriptional regulator [Deltaproteobacteria bacterium]